MVPREANPDTSPASPEVDNRRQGLGRIAGSRMVNWFFLGATKHRPKHILGAKLRANGGNLG